MNESDVFWMNQALKLAHHAAIKGEIPVGALIIRAGVVLGTGWNRPISTQDPTAHAEILALREAAQCIGNYRLLNTTLYCTLEPCVMCAGALVHARVMRVVFGAFDPKSGACGSVFHLLPTDARFNHHIECTGGVLATECGALLQSFFRVRRGSKITPYDSFISFS